MTFEEIRKYEVNAIKEISASGNHKKKRGKEFDDRCMTT
jgi:hypothetical protein